MKLVARIKAIEILLTDLNAAWVKSRDLGDPRKFAGEHGAALHRKLDSGVIPGRSAAESDAMSAEIRDAVEKLWRQTVVRFPKE